MFWKFIGAYQVYQTKEREIMMIYNNKISLDITILMKFIVKKKNKKKHLMFIPFNNIWISKVIIKFQIIGLGS